MQYISANIGHYSIKFIRFQINRKSIEFHSNEEVLLDNIDSFIDEESCKSISETIQNYLKQLETEEYQLICNVPSQLITERNIHIPVKNINKAKQMLPFQLEEGLPYPLAQGHFDATFRSIENVTEAYANIIRNDDFDQLYHSLNSSHVNAKLMTSESSALKSFVEMNSVDFPDNFVVMDMGHIGTNFYFFSNKTLVFKYSSNIAGNRITQIIAENYSITDEEAAIFKHQNSFVLTEGQKETVDEKQKAFSSLMDDTLKPLFEEFQRAAISYRVHYKTSPDCIYLIGGSSNIKNMDRYITEKLQLEVKSLDCFSTSSSYKMDGDSKQRNKYALSALMSKASLNKKQSINFLTGEYKSKATSDLPIYSASFILARVVMVALTLLFFTIGERIYLSYQTKKIDKLLTAAMKSSEIKLNPRQKRAIRKTPKTALNKLRKQLKTVNQEIKTYQSANSINALYMLQNIGPELRGLDVEVINFNSINKGTFALTLQTKDIDAFEQLDNIFALYPLKNKVIDKDEDKKVYRIEALEKI